MKKLLGLSLAIALFASCSDDDSASIDKDELVGKWYYVSFTANGETEPYDDHEPCGKDYIEFTADGKIIQVDVWDCNGNNPVTDEYLATYTVNGNKINVTTEEDSSVATIKSLNQQTLKISYRDDDDGDGDEETVTETYTSTP